MAKSVVYNRTDTPIAGVTELTIPIGLVNFGADFRIRTNEPGEAVITNITSPIDRPEKYRFAMNEVRDVYRNTGIDTTLYSPSRRGASVLCQLTDVWTVVDSVDPSYEVALPIEGHIVLKLPANENITADMVKAFVGRLVSGLFETGTTSSGRIRTLLRGSLLPQDL